MTLQELEILVNNNTNSINAINSTLSTIKQQITQLQASTKSISDSLSNYATSTQLNSIGNSVSSNATAITNLNTAVNKLNASIGLVNKISKLIDVNIVDLEKDDILQYDGDRWTNVHPNNIIPEQTVTLADLADVQINSDKANNHGIVWDNTLSKWTNKPVITQDSGGAIQIDMSEVWSSLSAVDSSKKIDISHCDWAINKNGGTGYNLKLEQGITVTGGANISNSGVSLNVGVSNVSVDGNIVSSGEITAYQ